MKIAVMGAGAVGCFFGARLHQAGHEVVLIGRPALVEAVRARGLHLQMAGFDGFLPLQATTDPAAVAGADVVLLCVKSGDTEAAGAAIAPHLAPGAAVLSLQNGVDNAPRLSAVLGRTAIPVAVYVAAGMAGPGHVVHHGRGELVLGPTPDSDRIAAALEASGIPASVSADVDAALWSKLTINCVYNGLSALTQLPYGELVRGPGVPAVMRDLYEECVAVAAAAGVRLAPELWDAVQDIARSMAGQHSSTARDVAHGHASEIDHINGHVVRLGAQLGVPVPANRTVHALVKLLDLKAGAAA